MEKRGFLKGQITIFFSLMLLLIMALVCTSLESARAAGMRLRLRLAADSSLQSAFAQYDKALWEEYGLLFRLDTDGSGAGLAQAITSYAEQNGSVDTASAGMDWFSYRVGKAEVQFLVKAVDQNGQVFRQAVSAYMRACGVAETAEEIWGRLNVIDESGKLTEAGTMWQSQSGKEEADLSVLQQEYDDLQEELAASQPAEHEAVDEEVKKEAESTVSNWMGTIRQFSRDGFLAFVVEDVSAVSDVARGREGCPSSLSEEEKGKSASVVPDTGIMDQLLFHEYIIRHMDSYTSEGSEGCEVEYVIAGKDSDRKNLSTVAGRLIWVREGFNLAYLLTDSEKRSQAEGIAAIVVGWTGVPGLVSGLSFLILSAWALGESVLDVRNLLRGEQIPLTKTAADWKLGIGGASELLTFEKKEDGDVSESSDNGLAYEDYLRIFLLLLDPEEEAYRAMDVIQRNIQEKNPAFKMEYCVYGAGIKLTSDTDALFPFLPGNAEYNMETNAMYSYGEVLTE